MCIRGIQAHYEVFNMNPLYWSNEGFSTPFTNSGVDCMIVLHCTKTRRIMYSLVYFVLYLLVWGSLGLSSEIYSQQEM